MRPKFCNFLFICNCGKGKNDYNAMKRKNEYVYFSSRNDYLSLLVKMSEERNFREKIEGKSQDAPFHFSSRRDNAAVRVGKCSDESSLQKGKMQVAKGRQGMKKCCQYEAAFVLMVNKLNVGCERVLHFQCFPFSRKNDKH